MNDSSSDIELSVIIPLYNCERYFERTIHCLEEQGVFDPSRLKAEVILVNDGSTDSTEALAQSAASKYPQIRLFSQANAGQHIARNVGLDNARGKWVYMMDNDDVLAPDVLSVSVRLVEENDVDVIRFNYIYTDEDGLNNLSSLQIPKMDSNVVYKGKGIDYITYRDCFNHGDSVIWTSIIKREYIEEKQIRFSLPIRYCEDMIFIWELFLSDPRVCHVSFDGYYWIKHPESDWHSVQNNIRHKKIRKLNCHNLALHFSEMQCRFNDVISYEISEFLYYKIQLLVYEYWCMLIKCGINDYRQEVELPLKEQANRGIYPIQFKLPPRKYFDNGLAYKVLWKMISSSRMLKIIMKMRYLFNRLKI